MKLEYFIFLIYGCINQNFVENGYFLFSKIPDLLRSVSLKKYVCNMIMYLKFCLNNQLLQIVNVKYIIIVISIYIKYQKLLIIIFLKNLEFFYWIGAKI